MTAQPRCPSDLFSEEVEDQEMFVLRCTPDGRWVEIEPSPEPFQYNPFVAWAGAALLV